MDHTDGSTLVIEETLNNIVTNEELDNKVKDNEQKSLFKPAVNMPGLQSEQQGISTEQKKKESEKDRKKEPFSGAVSTKSYEENLITIRYISDQITDYIPKSRITEISRYAGHSLAKTADMRKAEELKKTSGQKMQTRIGEFLTKGEGVTEKEMSDFLNEILEEDKLKNSGREEDPDRDRRLEGIRRLKDAKDSSEIRRAFEDSKGLVEARVDETREIPLSSGFFKDHPYAAKIVMIHKLLHMLEPSELSADVSLLYYAVTGSQEYRDEVKEQRQRRLKKEKDPTGTEVIAPLLKKLDEDRTDQLENLPPEHLPPSKVRLPGMDQGAAEYMRTLIKRGELSFLRDEEKEAVIRRITAGVPFLTSKERIELLSRKDVENLMAAVSERITNVPRIERIFAGNDTEYKEYLLDRLVLGQPYVGQEEYALYRMRRKKETEDARKYLTLNEEYSRSKKVRLRILQGRDMTHLNKKSSSKSGDPVARARRRIDRIGELNSFLSGLFEKERMNPPDTFYHYKNKPENAGLSLSKCKSGYGAYLEGFFKNEKKTRGGKDNLIEPAIIMGKEYKTLSAIGKLIKENYSEYGLKNDELFDLVKEAGEGLYDKSHKDYLDKLAEARGRVPQVLKPEMDEKAGKFNDRLNGFMHREDEDFSSLMPVLADDDRFLEHLAGDDEEEYEIFLAKAVPACRALMEEIRQHLYVDQYLIERKKEIADIVISGQTENIPDILALQELDRAIEDTKIDGKTFKTILRENVDLHKESDRSEVLYGELVMKLVMEEGAGVVLDKKLLGDRRARLSANLKSLEETFKTAESGLKSLKEYEDSSLLNDMMIFNRKKELVNPSDYLFDLLIHKEKTMLLSAAPEEYGRDLKDRVKDELKNLLNEYNTKEKEEEERAAVAAESEEILKEKEAGRKTVNDLFDESKKSFSLLSPKQFEDTKPREDIRAGLVETMKLARQFMGDPLLEPIYTAYLKRMAVFAKTGDLVSIAGGRNALLHLLGFSQAVDEYMKLNGEIPKADRPFLKKGLFEVHAASLIRFDTKKTTSETELKEHYLKTISEFMDKNKDAVRFVMDDRGGYTGIGNTAVKDEGTYFEELCEFIRGYDELEVFDILDRFSTYTRDDICLLAYLLQNSESGCLLIRTLSKITGVNASDEINLDDSATIMAYLRGETLNPAMLGLDLSDAQRYFFAWGAERFKSNIRGAVRYIDELKDIREQKRWLSKQSALPDALDAEMTRLEMNKAWETAMDYSSDLSEEELLPNEEKLWRFYSVIRTYSDVLARYKECFDLGRIDPKEYKEKGALVEIYAQLQEYFSSEKRDPQAAKKIYGRKVIRRMGILTDEEFEDENRERFVNREIKDEEVRQQISEVIRGYDFEKTGKKQIRERKLKDDSESEFSDAIVAEVKKIDRWIAEHSIKHTGDSGVNTSIEVLSHPMRERIFIYYLIENEREGFPTQLDAAMAMQGYVPDLERFKDKIRHNFLFGVINFAKSFDLVKSIGVLDNYGRISSHKIETGLRMLDNPDTDFSGYLQERLNDRKVYEDPDLPEEVKVRQACYASFMDELTQYRALVKNKSEEEIRKEMKHSSEIARQDLRVRRALRRLVRANDDVKRIGKADELTDRYSSAKRTQLPWNFDGEKLDALVKKKGALNYAGMVFCVASAIVSVEAAFDPYVSNVKEVRNAFETTYQVGRAVGRVSTYCSLIVPIAGGAVDQVAHLTGSVAISVAATGKAVISGKQRYDISKAEKEALRMEEEKETKQEQKTEDQKNEEEKTKEEKQVKERTEEEKAESERKKHLIRNIAAIEKRISNGEIVSNTLRATGAAAAVVTALVPLPFDGVLVDAIHDLTSGFRMIYNFWYKRDQRKKSVDEFLEIDKLYEKVKPYYKKLSGKSLEKLGFLAGMSEDVKKDLVKDAVRKEVLRQLHYSTMEEFFLDISFDYAKEIYRHIFFDEEGSRIKASDSEKIEQRKPLCGLFPNLTFTYPENDGELPSPPIEAIVQDMTRDITK